MKNSSYKVGELSEVISQQKHKRKKEKITSEKEKEKLADLFSRPNRVEYTNISASSTNVATEVPDKKKKGSKRKLSEVEPVLNLSQVPQKGYCPPPGIVHEAITKEIKRRKTEKKKTSGESPNSLTRNGRTVKNDKDDGKPEYPPRRKKKRDLVEESRTIFVGNLSVSSDVKSVKRLFKKFGKIETVRIRCAVPADPKVPKKAAVITKEFHPERKSFVAFIRFEEESAAKNALELNGSKVNDLHLRVDMATNAKQHDHRHSIFVGNLPYNITEEAVRSHFEVCGTVDNVRIVRDRKTGLGKGFGYVLYQSVDSVNLALKLNDSELSGRKIRVVESSKNHKTETKLKHKELTDKKKRSQISRSSFSNPSEGKNKFGKPIARKFRPSNVQSSFQGFKADKITKKRQKSKLKKTKPTKSGLIIKHSLNKDNKTKDMSNQDKIIRKGKVKGKQFCDSNRKDGKLKDLNGRGKTLTKGKVKHRYFE